MAELFDQYDKNYGDVVGDSISFSGLKHDFFMQAKADLIERKLAGMGKLAPDSKLAALDIGCGIGTMHRYIRPLFDTIDGCDVSSESVERASRENPGVCYRHYEAGSELPYQSETFDFAMTVCVVHHVPPAFWPEFFSEMHRVLKPGGLACVIEHNPFNPATRLAVLRCPFDEDAVLLRSGKTHSLMRAAGFKTPKSEFFLALPSAKPLARRLEQSISSLPVGAQYASFATV